MADLGNLYRQVGLDTNIAPAKVNGAYFKQPVAKPQKQSFFGNLGRSALSLPAQAIGAVGNAIASPFVNLGKNAITAANAGKNAKASQMQSVQIEKKLAAAKSAYKAGKLSKQDYLNAIRGSKQAYLSLSAQNQAQQVKSIPQMLPDAAGAIFTAATLGAGGLAKGAGQAALKAIPGGGSRVGSFVGKGIDATIGSGQSLAKGALPSLAGKSVRNAVVTQPVVQAPFQIQQDLQKGDMGSAALNTALLAAPAGLSVAGKGIKALNIGEKTFGTPAVLTDALGGRVAEYLAKNPEKAAILKQMEQFTLNQPAVGGDVKKAGPYLEKYLKSIGVDPKSTDLDQITKQFAAYEGQVRKLEDMKTPESSVFKAGTKGVVPDNAVVSADFRDAIPGVIAKLKGKEGLSGTDKARIADEALDEAGIQNETVRAQIKAALVQGARPGELKAIVQKAIVPGVKLDKGFIATFGPAKRAGIPTIKEATELGAPELGKAPSKVLGALAGGLRKAGIGLDDYNPAQIGDFRKNFAALLEARVPGKDAKQILNELDELGNLKRVSDPRQLRVAEIGDRLGVTTAEAKLIRNSMDDAFLQVGKSTRGIANKAQDLNIKYNPLARSYGRVQSALRYGFNPVFRAQQRIEAGVLGRTVTGGHIGTKEVQDTVNKMEQAGFLPKAGGSYTGEAMEGTKGLTSISAELTPFERRELARTLTSIAQKNGSSIDDELKNEQTRKLLRMIVQNPKTGFLSSNFARALNLALFPLSYNLKVATLAGKALASQPKPVQFAVLKGVADFDRFLKTDEGIKWTSDNSELLGLINYFTPINSIQQIMNGVTSGNIRNLGLVGGLPFGIISRVLEGQGAIPKANPPYVNPKTGEVTPEQLPEGVKARVQVALSDMIDTIFTYPGRQAGLGSKTQLIDTLTGGVLKPGKGESTAVDRSDKLTDAQRNQMRVLSRSSAPSVPSVKPPERKIIAPPIAKPNLALSGVKPKALKGRRPKTKAKRPGEKF